jgi:hypothetical protein
MSGFRRNEAAAAASFRRKPLVRAFHYSASAYIATAAAAATLRLSMPWRIGICTTVSAAEIASA